MRLRTAIDFIILEVLTGPSSPPWMPVEELQELHQQTEQLRRAFAARAQGWPEVLRQAPDTLARFSSELRDLARYMPTKKQVARLGAYKAHRVHLLRELRDLWVTTLGGEPTGKAIETFLKACLETALDKPETTSGVRKWLERHDQGDVYFHY
jgi:hypothetical protein